MCEVYGKTTKMEGWVRENTQKPAQDFFLLNFVVKYVYGWIYIKIKTLLCLYLW